MNKNKKLRMIAIVIMVIFIPVMLYWIVENLIASPKCVSHLGAGMQNIDVIKLCGQPDYKKDAVINREHVVQWYYNNLIIEMDEESKLFGYHERQ